MVPCFCCCPANLSHLITTAVDARNVNGHVNHVAAQLVRGHVHGVEVGGDVNPRDHIEQERFFHHTVLVQPKGLQSHGGGSGGDGDGGRGLDQEVMWYKTCGFCAELDGKKKRRNMRTRAAVETKKTNASASYLYLY